MKSNEPLDPRINLPDIVPSGIHLFYFPEIRSDQENHRNLLRQQTIEELLKVGYKKNEVESLNDLNQLPSLKKGWVSLSHSPKGSAILISQNKGPVGVDVEVKARINPALVKRISTDSEINDSPDGFDLFTAKEAAWKALNQKQSLATISHIETHQWSQLAPKEFQYYVKKESKELPGFGVGCEFSDVYISFFLSP